MYLFIQIKIHKYIRKEGQNTSKKCGLHIEISFKKYSIKGGMGVKDKVTLQ